MLEQALDYHAECDALHAHLAAMPEAFYSRATQFKRWTADDVLGHLHMFDVAAKLTLESDDGFAGFTAGIRKALGAGLTVAQYTHKWLEGCRGPALLARWHGFATELAALYGAADPGRRVRWGGPPMSVRSCISARQMETWAHGQALWDLAGHDRDEHDRIRNIVVIGVNTFGFSFVNRKLAVPPRPALRLVSPSGAIWEWPAEAGSQDRIEGSAAEFCRVVAQTRNVADTALAVHGDAARRWMSIAQCFAGPPVEPPAAGTRHTSAAPG
ncbi:MAG: TIGR03084 family metal-binding protein [Gammaproteobacteria bacterium]